MLGYAQKHVEARRSEVDEVTAGVMLSLAPGNLVPSGLARLLVWELSGHVCLYFSTRATDLSLGRVLDVGSRDLNSALMQVQQALF